MLVNKKVINALVVKLVDTKDLKSLPVWECRFESGRGHQKIIFIILTYLIKKKECNESF